VLRPSEDIGLLAEDHLRRHRTRLCGLFGRSLLSLLDVGGGADLASYLLFDGAFGAELIALGRRDAEARGDELFEFLGAGKRKVERSA
jgi:NTE family protein